MDAWSWNFLFIYYATVACIFSVFPIHSPTLITDVSCLVCGRGMKTMYYTVTNNVVCDKYARSHAVEGMYNDIVQIDLIAIFKTVTNS